jgi:hypothetical protein
MNETIEVVVNSDDGPEAVLVPIDGASAAISVDGAAPTVVSVAHDGTVETVLVDHDPAAPLFVSVPGAQGPQGEAGPEGPSGPPLPGSFVIDGGNF